MSGKNSNSKIFSKFFKKDQADFLGREETALDSILSDTNLSVPPTLEKDQIAETAEMDLFWRKLRSFFRSGTSEELWGLDDKMHFFPALLYPYKTLPMEQTEYPIWVAEKQSSSSSDPIEISSKPLTQLIIDAIAEFAPDTEDARVLREQIPTLEKYIKNKLDFADGLFSAFPVFEEALGELADAIEIHGEDKDAFLSDLSSLKKHLPHSGALIPHSSNAVYYLLSASIALHFVERRKNLSGRLHDLITALEDLLIIEKEKQHPDLTDPSMEFAEDFIDFNDLSNVLPASGTESMNVGRLNRIERAVGILKNAESTLLDQHAVFVIRDNLFESETLDWDNTFPGSSFLTVSKGKISNKATEQFDLLMKDWSTFFVAMRIGKLEIENQYQTELHDEFFAHFNWRSFTDEEISACPLMIAVEESGEILKNELYDFSYLLSTYRPVKLLLIERGGKPGSRIEKYNEVVFRQEIGALSISHRDTFTLQSSVVTPSHMMNGFLKGSSNFSPAVFHILNPSLPEKVALWTSAAIEGREFPCFVYDSELGPKWGSRFNVMDNPQPRKDWPLHHFEVGNGKDELKEIELAFTWADFASLDPRYDNHFCVVPAKFWSDELVSVDQYLDLPQEEAYLKIPFIWMVDGDNRLRKVAVSMFIALSSKERLDYWHYIQENAGVNNYHVEKAVEKTREELEQETVHKISELKEKYDKEIFSVKDEAASDAMERLADILLDIESTPAEFNKKVSVADSADATPEKVLPNQEDDTIAEETENKENEEEAVLSISEEPWIESVLCTTCNECTDINKQIFQYNKDKQAYIADPKGGTYADIVRAAENCPVKIIHPGKPLNPEEPGLDELIKRAEPFN